jgi:hypothetical protein
MTMVQFIWGALTMGTWTVALYFLRFWRTTRDRLFGGFAAAFAVLGVNWLFLAIFEPSKENQHYFYLVRLAAFILLIASVIDKNRSRRKG